MQKPSKLKAARTDSEAIRSRDPRHELCNTLRPSWADHMGFETALLLNQICKKGNGQIIGCSDGSRCAAKLGLRQFPLVSPRRVRQRISVRLRFDFFQPRLDQRMFRVSSQNWRHDWVRAGRRRHTHSGGRSRTRQGNCLREIFRRNGIGRRCNAQCAAQKDQSHNKGSPGCKSSFPALLSITCDAPANVWEIVTVMWPSFYHYVIGTEFRSRKSRPPGTSPARVPRTFCEPAHGAIRAVVRWARPDRDRSAGARPRNSPTARLFFSLEREPFTGSGVTLPQQTRRMFMDEDRIKGSAEQAKGKLKKWPGS